MALTSARKVTSGYFRVHLLVVLGLNTLACLVAVTTHASDVWPPLVAAVASYFGSVLWLYEKSTPGKWALIVVAVVSLVGAWLSLGVANDAPAGSQILAWLVAPAGGFLLGAAMAAMFLGHWYLNTPTMELVPLRRLGALMLLAVFIRMILSGLGIGFEFAMSWPKSTSLWLLLSFRWIAGLVGVLGLGIMTWRTLRVPNTQSATGILYVCVIGTFIGELIAEILSAELTFPV